MKLLPDHQSVQAGPLALVRHPMYLGRWVSLAGLMLIYCAWIVAGSLAMSLVVLYRRARLEEVTLVARFGEQWQAYIY